MRFSAQEDAIISGFIQSGTDTTPWITQRKTRARTRARTSPSPLPVFEISTRKRFSPLRESECDDALISSTSMIRHVRATSGKGKVCTRCFPGAHVLDVAAQVPEILNGDERVGAVVLNVGVNDIRLSDACGETTLPVSCWIGGQRLKHHKPMLTRQCPARTTSWITQRKTRARTRARTSPPPLPVFEISTRKRFSPLRESERDATVIMGTSMIRHIRATSGKDKVCTHCFPGAHVLDVAAQLPEILNGDEHVGAVVLNVGANDIRLRF
ncbi:hypothetical protein F2P79_022821 [Pimephales promelas]|nr:hypothetical protein F2P79_022821 [Pimephales promelas]